MAEETQASECNGDSQPEVSQMTNIIDQVDTSLVCEAQGNDPLVTSDSKVVSDIHLADNVDISHLENKENPEEASGEHPGEHETIHEKNVEMLTSHQANFEEHGNEGDSQDRLETKGVNILSDDSLGQEELPEQEIKHGESKTELEDVLPYEDTKHLTHSAEEETLTETEEENTSIETDNDDDQGSCDEHENGSLPYQSNPEDPGSGNRPDISRHSYARYDTVSYRKIRKGNTKQRIDEFESMMN